MTILDNLFMFVSSHRVVKRLSGGKNQKQENKILKYLDKRLTGEEMMAEITVTYKGWVSCSVTSVAQTTTMTSHRSQVKRI